MVSRIAFQQHGSTFLIGPPQSFYDTLQRR